MKRHFSKLTALILSLAMAISLALPAIALEDTDPPLWQEWGCSSLEEFLEWFDVTEEEYYQMAADMLENQARVQAWIDSHPQEVAAFDADAYFAEEYDWYDSVQDYLDSQDMTRAEFEQKMLERWVAGLLFTQEQDQAIAQFKADYPKECAAFDPYAYYDKGYYPEFYGTAQEYKEWLELTEDEFYQNMFVEWMAEFLAMLEAKEQLGGSAQGINVMVNGQCVSFPDARPELKNGRTMVPLRSAMEHLGAKVDYDTETKIAQVSMDGLSFTHVIGTDTLALSDGSTVKMDVPSYIQAGRTMVPVRFFSQVLGYEVLWDSDYQTAVLLDRQKLIDSIDQDFTLLSRLIHAVSGADQIKAGQALEQSLRLDLDLTLFDTLHGDKKIPADLSASALVGDKSIELKISGDLSGLIDYLADSGSMYLDGTDLKQLRAALNGFSARIILNLDPGAVYLYCPALAKLEPELGDPDSWFAFPVDLSELEGLGLSFASLTQPGTVGQILWDNGAGSPFWRWSAAVESAEELKGDLGDSQFTKSGSAYTLSIEETKYTWDGDEQTYALKLTIAPVGEKSCTYTVSFDLTSDDMVVDADLKGSSGKADLKLSLHMKNTFKLALEGASRISGSEKSPLTEPPKGSKIQFPAGAVGSGRR